MALRSLYPFAPLNVSVPLPRLVNATLPPPEPFPIAPAKVVEPLPPIVNVNVFPELAVPAMTVALLLLSPKLLLFVHV
jgi:hypothetical protein